MQSKGNGKVEGEKRCILILNRKSIPNGFRELMVEPIFRYLASSISF